MRVEVRARQSGKTHDMILRAHGIKAQIVCFSLSECKRVSELAKEMGTIILSPMTFEKYLRDYAGGDYCDEFYIDNLDLCLSYTTGHKKIGLVTISSGEGN